MCRFFAVHEKKEKKEPKKRKKSKLLVNYNLSVEATSKQQASYIRSIGLISPTTQTVHTIKSSTAECLKPNNPKNGSFLHFYCHTLSNYTQFTISFKNTPVLRLIIENKTQQHPPGVGMGG